MAERNRVSSSPGIVAVHVGAGHFKESNVSKLKDVCKNACSQGIKALENKDEDISRIIALVVKELEDSPLTNTGIGSSLSLTGHVECDASIMDGRSGAFGAVGAVSSVRNPILAALSVMEVERKKFLKLGRIPPMIVVGDGGRRWASDHGVEVCHPDDLLTTETKAVYVDHMERLEKCSGLATMSDESAREKLDTVGAVGVDRMGNVSAACSSGGISLKYPGRIGQSACYGSGCWAISGDERNPAVGVCTTGTGEHIMKTFLARQCAIGLHSSSEGCLQLKKLMKDNFLSSPMLSYVEEKFGGILALLQHHTGQVEIGWAHTTQHMIVGYYDGLHNKPIAHHSEMNSEEMEGKDVHFGTFFQNYDFR